MTPFAQFEGVASRSLLAVFGETAQIWPQAQGGYVAPAVDADRMATSVCGILSIAAAPAALMDGRPATGVRSSSRILSERTRFWIPAEGARTLGFRPRDGDRLELPERGVTYGIIAVETGVDHDLLLILAAGSPA